jgi:urea transport system substrate-binding protein
VPPSRTITDCHCPLRLALAIPLSGPLGLLGPASLAAARLALEEVNAAGGIAGRPLELTPVDAGDRPEHAARRIFELAVDRSTDAVVGMHTSAVRRAISSRVAGRLPYVYTPPHEGGARAEGLFTVGASAAEQLTPALAWLVRQRLRRWALIGNDYIWPRRVNALARRELAALGACARTEVYLPFGERRLGHWLRLLRAARPDALLVTLIGEELVRFERALAGEPRLARAVQLCLALDENVLLGFADAVPDRLFAAMEYFAAAPTEAGRELARRYHARFGPEAPVLGVYAQSCYEGVHALATLAARAQTLELGALQRASEGAWLGVGREPRMMRAGAVRARVYMAHANAGRLEVLAALPSPRL